MKFVADEGVDRKIVESLRAGDHDVLYVAELSPGMPDDDVIDLANRGPAVLITSDKDFGELVFRQHRVHEGLILIRLHGLSAGLKADTVLAAVTSFGDQLAHSFCVLSPGTVRIRRPL